MIGKSRGQAAGRAPIASAVADGGNRQNLSTHGDNRNHVEEVIDNNHHRGFPIIRGRR